MSFIIQRFDALGLQATFTANANSGAVVNVFGTSALSANRLGVVIFNASQTDAMAIRIAAPSANAASVASLPTFATVAPQTEKFIAVNGSLNVWARSLTANSITGCGAHEVK